MDTKPALHSDPEIVSSDSASSDDGVGSDDSASISAAFDDIDGVLSAFCAMEYRRLRRIRNGRMVKDGLGRHVNSAMRSIIVVLLLAEVFDITTQRFGIQQVWLIPTALTIALVVPAVMQTVYYPEHTFTLWVSTELYAFCLWFAWWFDAREASDRDQQELTCWALPTTGWLAAEKICLDNHQVAAIYVFLAVLTVTILLFIPHRLILPCAVYFNLCEGRWLVGWRCVRKLRATTNQAWHYTYKPSGVFGWNSAEFMYVGEVDTQHRPHGQGVWYDTSFHGEVLRGEWVHGAPAGMWNSREYGTGAQFLQCAVGYATSRADCQKDALHKSSMCPQKDSKLRFGVGQVEASFAGGFFPFLPAVNYHNEMPDVEEMADRLLENYKMRQATEDPQIRLEVVSEGSAKEIDMVGPSQVAISFPEGESVGYVSDLAVSRVKSIHAAPEALVFIHGFNCDLATALGRVAQTFSLGNMPPHIVPFVFSYAGGAELTYFHAKSRFKDYGADFASFLRSLSAYFSEVHILTHSCGAEFFFTNWHSIASCFSPRHGSDPSAARSAKKRRFIAKKTRRMEYEGTLHLATLTMLNPDVLLSTVNEKLPDIMRKAEHFTSYNDSNDGALFWSGVVRSALSCVTGRGCRKQKLFGTCVQSLFMESYANGEHTLNSGAARGLHRRHTLDGRIVGRRLTSGASSQLSLNVKPHIPGDGTIDIIDCSNIDQNVHALRHNYFMLNTQMVEDVCQLIGHRQKAPGRSRLCQHGDGNVFSFLSPPSFVKS